MRSEPSRGTLRRFFAGITEYAFHTRVGVADPPLVDYLSEMLTRFIRSEELFGIRNPSGARLHQVVDMLSEAQERQGVARRKAHRFIGDFTLFWTGVYPEALPKLRKAGQKDSLIDYPSQGKRAYYIASTIPTEREDAKADVLERLSRNFELCVYGLGEVRRELDQCDDLGESSLIWGC